MSDEAAKLRLQFTDAEWLEIEVQAAAVGMDTKDYLRDLLKDAIDDMRADLDQPDTLH